MSERTSLYLILAGLIVAWLIAAWVMLGRARTAPRLSRRAAVLLVVSGCPVIVVAVRLLFEVVVDA